MAAKKIQKKRRTGIVHKEVAVVLHLTEADWEYLLATLSPAGRKWIRTRSRPVLPSERVMALMMGDL